ncbi:MAG: cation:proton antiporter [Phycisphaeraceae bacterium]
MMMVMVILLAAAAAMGLARALKLPSVPLVLIAGIGLAASGVVDDPAMMQDVLVLGLTFLVFAAGVELSPQRVGAQRMAAVKVGVAQFFIVAAVGVLGARGVGLTWVESLYVGLAVTASSTLVVVRLLQQRRQLFEPFGRLVLGVLLLQDVLIIALIAAVGRVDDGPIAIALAVAGTILLVGLAWLAARYLVPRLLLGQNMDEETLLVMVLAILFAFVGASQWMGVPLVAGAFLGGVSLSAFPVNGVVRGQLASLNDFFMAVFFVTLGATLTWPGITLLLAAVVVAALVLLATPPLVYLVARRAGLSARSSVESGLLLAQTSEFSLIIALVGVEQNQLPDTMLVVIAIVTVATMMLTPLIATDAVTWRLMRWIGWRRRLDVTHPPRDHVLLLGCGENGMKLLKRLVAHGHTIVVVDDDAGVIERVEQLGVTGIRGDGADPAVLNAAGASHARVIVSTLRRLQDNESLLSVVRDVPVFVRVFAPEEARRLEAAGGKPMLESEAATIEFLKWYDATFPPQHPPKTNA